MARSVVASTERTKGVRSQRILAANRGDASQSPLGAEMPPTTDDRGMYPHVGALLARVLERPQPAQRATNPGRRRPDALCTATGPRHASC